MAQDHSFRVSHERTGEVAYEGESFTEASGIQYGENILTTEKLWRMWLVDEDGHVVKVQTQI